jgi:hypothetical protein
LGLWTNFVPLSDPKVVRREEAIFMEAELPEEEEGNTMETPSDVEGDSM